MPPFSSPFPTTSSKPGHGSVVLSLLPPTTPTFTTLSYTYPLKLLPSTPHTIPPPPKSSSTGGHASATHQTRGLAQQQQQQLDGPTAKAAEEAEANNNREPNDASSNHPSAASPALPSLNPTTTTTSSSTLDPPVPPPQVPSHTALLFLLTYGGGLLAGDRITLHLVLKPGTRLAVATQGMGKVFPPPHPPPPPPAAAAVPSHNNNTTTTTTTPPTNPSTQTLTAQVGRGAALFLAPDPTQPFRRSRYIGRQTFEVARGGSVGVVEWVVQGRGARGERWDWGAWRSGIDVFELSEGFEEGGSGGVATEAGKEEEGKARSGRRRRLLVRDNIILDNADERLKHRMHGMGVVGTLILHGPLFASLAGFFVREFEGLERIGGRDWEGGPTHDGDDDDDDLAPTEEGADLSEERRRRRREKWRGDRQRMEKEQGVVWTACHVRGGKCCVVKFMAREMQGARDWLGGMLREEATVGREFGEGGLMFVR